jgi:hypothetical protein
MRRWLAWRLVRLRRTRRTGVLVVADKTAVITLRPGRRVGTWESASDVTVGPFRDAIVDTVTVIDDDGVHCWTL